MQTDPVCNMTIDEKDALRLEHEGNTVYFCSEGCRDTFMEREKSQAKRGKYELIIIGGGPAGLTAAVYASRLKVNAFVIMNDIGGQAIDSRKIENYMGYDFITGPELVKKFEDQLLQSHYIDHLVTDVEKIDKVGEAFKIITSDLEEFQAQTLIIATGMSRRKLSVPGEEEFQRIGIFYGNLEDYSFVQGKEVAVIGGGNSALQIVEDLQSIAARIHLVSDFELTADPVIVERVNKLKNLIKHEFYKVEHFDGDKALSSITVREKAGRKEFALPVKGVFISIGLQPNSSLVRHLVEVNEGGEIKIGSDCKTSLEGIFAAGDVTDAFGKRIIIASGEGAKAAMAARKRIIDLRKD